jgi:hypothetical protein
MLAWGEIRPLRAEIITVASFNQTQVSAKDFVYTNNGTNANFNTSGSIGVTVTVDATIAGQAGIPVILPAHLSLTSNTTSTVSGSSTLTEHFPSATNTLAITLDTPIRGKTNFLTVTYSDLLSGENGSDQVSLKASDAGGTDTVHFTSDFIDFSKAIEHGMSLTFSSVTSANGGGGLHVDTSNNFFASFSASGVGSFDMTITPEPASLTLAGLGTLVIGGIGLARRKGSASARA